jgi:branched-subunit amino acid transport protein AzlD
VRNAPWDHDESATGKPIDLHAPDRGLGPILGTAATIGVHAWRHNAVLSILAGTTVCLLIVNTI